MAKKFISMRNLKFLIYEVFDVVALTKHEYYAQHNRKIFDMVLDAGMKLAVKLLFPLFEEMDRKPPEFEAGSVKVHPQVRELMKQYGEGGWIASTFSEELDGEQLPLLVANCCNMMFSAANYSGAAFPGLAAGAARLIANFGSQELIDRYVAKMLAKIPGGPPGVKGISLFVVPKYRADANGKLVFND